jgi:SAM-dependent methyltransferase
MAGPHDELTRIHARYDRRQPAHDGRLYDPMDPYVTCTRQERERAWIGLFRTAGLEPVEGRRVLEVGCGGGANLLDLVRLGFRPQSLVGNEIRSDRLEQARERLPQGVTLVAGDASTLDLPDASFDVVLQSTVFTSILDDGFQERLATRMWALVKPGGGVLWYDFVWNNPRNPDVRGVPVRRVRALFPEGVLRVRSVTLAPPLGRRFCAVAPWLYPLVNLPWLRSHRLCWIGKPGS